MGKLRKNELAQGVSRFGRATSLRRTGRHLHFKKGQKGDKKEETKATVQREPRFYAADDIRKKKYSRKHNRNPTKLRSSLTPGTILILLTGRFRGKRVVFLKQLSASGLLLVTGPYKINGVPLRRVNQAFVIATSTKIDIAGADVSKIEDDFFKKEKKEKEKKDAEAFFGEEPKKKELSPERKEAQKKVDSKLLPVIAKVPQLRHYLNAKFSLTRGQAPHLIKF